MTMTLTYLDDLSRVRIELTDLEHDGRVRVERALVTADPPWETVRGGAALPVTGGTAQLDDYEFADLAANHYRVLQIEPPPGLIVPGDVGGTASAPDAASLDVANELELVVDLALNTYEGTGSARYMFSKYDFSADERSYALRISGSGFLQLLISSNGTGFSTANSEVLVSDLVENGERITFRATVVVDDSTGDWEARFFVSDTIDDAPTQVGVIDTGTTTNPELFNSTAPLVVGGPGPTSQDSDNMASGMYFAALVRNLETDTVADPRFDQQADGATSFDDDAGNTWTINGSASIVGSGALESASIIPDLEGETWLKSIRYPALNRVTECNLWQDIDRSFQGGIFPVQGRSLPVAVTDLRQGRRYVLQVVTRTPEQERDLELALTASGTFFLHVAHEEVVECENTSAIPGGYFVIDTTNQRRATVGSQTMVWTLPMIAVAPPEPQVAGTTLTWRTVERLYGSWTALWASNSTWRDLWATIADPDDMVVF